MRRAKAAGGATKANRCLYCYKGHKRQWFCKSQQSMLDSITVNGCHAMYPILTVLERSDSVQCGQCYSGTPEQSCVPFLPFCLSFSLSVASATAAICCLSVSPSVSVRATLRSQDTGASPESHNGGHLGSSRIPGMAVRFLHLLRLNSDL